MIGVDSRIGRLNSGPVRCQPVSPIQRVVKLAPRGWLPAPEIGVPRGPSWENGWQGPPLVARARAVTHRIQDALQTQAPVAMHGQQRRPDLLLRVSKGLMAINHIVAGALERQLQRTDSFLFSLPDYLEHPLTAWLKKASASSTVDLPLPLGPMNTLSGVRPRNSTSRRAQQFLMRR